MFRLTREVRFAVNENPVSLSDPPTNSFAGFPTLNGYGRYYRLQVTLEGELDPRSRYLRNIKEIDEAVRMRIVGRMAMEHLTAAEVYQTLQQAFVGQTLYGVTLWFTPFLSITQLGSEIGMNSRLSQRFEFSASHRLHNPNLSDEENRKIFGKCNSPNGHGHNYEVQVTLRGTPGKNGLLVAVPALEQVVKQHVIDRLDHKNLNLDVPEFAELIPTVENIAMTIYRMLKRRFSGIGAELASVTVWETPKTWCEYFE